MKVGAATASDTGKVIGSEFLLMAFGAAITDNRPHRDSRNHTAPIFRA